MTDRPTQPALPLQRHQHRRSSAVWCGGAVPGVRDHGRARCALLCRASGGPVGCTHRCHSNSATAGTTTPSSATGPTACGATTRRSTHLRTSAASTGSPGRSTCPPPRRGTRCWCRPARRRTGRDFAARYAEAVFTAHQSLADAQSFYAGLKQRALRHGRDPETVKSCPIIGATEAEAPALEAELDRLTGTPEQVADAITDRYDQGAADGFTAGQPQHRRPGRVVTAPRP
jgi:hypothetical protein